MRTSNKRQESPVCMNKVDGSLPDRPGGGLITLVLAIAVGGCATQAQTPFRQEQILRGNNTAGSLNQADAAFVTAAYRVAQLDNSEGQLAATQSSNPQLRQLAAEIVAKANQLYPQLEAEIAKNGITAPRELPADLRGRLDRLRDKRGRAFDQQYLADQVETHQQAIQAFETEQAHTQDPSMRSLAELALPVVRDDLGRLQALQER